MVCLAENQSNATHIREQNNLDSKDYIQSFNTYRWIVFADNVPQSLKGIQLAEQTSEILKDQQRTGIRICFWNLSTWDAVSQVWLQNLGMIPGGYTVVTDCIYGL